MGDVIKGMVKKIINGDAFELEVADILSGDSINYNDDETIKIASFAEDEEDAEPIGDYPSDDEIGSEEMGGTLEEISMESSKAHPTQYYGVRSMEDLEARILGKMVLCRVMHRNSSEELVSDVEVI